MDIKRFSIHLALALTWLMSGARPTSARVNPFDTPPNSQERTHTFTQGQVPDGVRSSEWEKIKETIHEDESLIHDDMLTASDGESGDWFGYAVAVDGNIIVVAAYFANVGDNEYQGAAYVFYKNQGGGDNWSEVKKLTASDGAAEDYFGTKVSVSGDTIVVGADGADIDGKVDQGAVYIFGQNFGGPDNWGEVKKLIAPDGLAEDYFSQVSLSGDVLAVGAGGADIDANIDQGAAYVFYRDHGGANNWGQVKKLIASDGAAGDAYGRVSLSGDKLVVGAFSADIDDKANQGAAYVYYQDQGGTDNWGEVKKLVADDGAIADRFGRSIIVNGDTIAVTASHADVGGNADQGAAYIYSQNQSGADQWGQVRKLVASDGTANDLLGYSVSISGDMLVIGAHRATISSHPQQGAAYVFRRDQGGIDNWGEVEKLTQGYGSGYDQFGYSVFVSGEFLVIGAPGYKISESDSPGAAFVYTASIYPLYLPAVIR